MRKCLNVIFVLLFLFVSANALAEPALNQELESPVELLQERYTYVSEDGESVVEPFRIRAAYRIELPGDTSDVNEVILESYSPYQKIYLIEISPSYAEIGPILSSQFYCVGLLDDGTYELCSTPQRIVSRIYDYQPLESLIITPLDPYIT